MSRDRSVPLAILSAAAVGVTWAHVLAREQGPSYAGPLLIGTHLFTLGAVAALLLLCAALGARVLSRAGTLEARVEALPLAVAVGIGIAGTALLAAGAVGGLRPWGLALVLAALTALAWPALPRARDLFASFGADLRWAIPDRELRALALVGLGGAALFLVVTALAPADDWDALMYHLDVPAEFLRAGRVFLPEDNLHVSLVGPLHMLYVPLLAVGAPAGPAVLSAVLALLLAVTILAYAARFFSATTAALGSLAFWGNAAILLVAVTPRVDVSVTLYVLLGQLALLLAWGEGGRRWYLLGAVLLGLAVAVKLQALAYILALSPLVVWLAWKRPWEQEGAETPGVTGRGSRDFFPTLLTFAACGVLATLPWLLKNQILLGGPFYPLLSERVLPPWLAEIFGSRAVPTVDPYAFQVLGAVRRPFDLVAAFLSPEELTVEDEGRFYFLSPLLVLLPLAALGLRTRANLWLLLGGLGYLAAALLPFSRTNLRYLIPGFVPLTLAATWGWVLLLERLVPSRGVRLRIAALGVLLSLAPAGWAALDRLTSAPVTGWAVGTTSATEYLARRGGVADLRELVNAFVPPEGRVLVLFDARGFGLERSVLQDNYLYNWPLLAASGAPERCLDGTGITHVLIAQGPVQYYLGRGMDAERMQLPALGAFARECLQAVAQSPSLILYRLEPGAGAAEALQ